jgi:hypothetical protein
MAAGQARLRKATEGAAAAASSAPAATPAGGVQAHDQEQIYCSRLGHYLQFSYCRRAEAGEPCPRAVQCWYDRPAVLEYLRATLAPDALAGGGSHRPPLGKLESILAIVARLRAREEGGSPPG